MVAFLTEYGAMILWGLVMVGTLVLEALTADMVCIWFAPGAFVAFLMSFFIPEFWIQLVTFCVLSLILFLWSKNHFKKHPFIKKTNVNADSFVGEDGVVTETIDNLKETGSVKARFMSWTARSADGDVIPEGTVVTVTEIQGVKLICRPKK